MKSIKSILDAHLQNIEQNRNEVVSRVMEQFEATFPLLIGYLLYLRKINGIQNKIDDLNKSAQMIKEFNYLCEHNLLFFLTVTGQFNIIRELFQDKAELARAIALIDETEKEYNKTALNQPDFLLLPKITQTEKQSTFNPYLNGLDQSVYGLNAMMMYEYYEKELTHLTYTHHIKQSKIYSHAANEELNELNLTIESVMANKRIDPVAKTACLRDLANLREKISKEKDIYESVSERFYRSGSQNEQEAELVHLAGRNYFNEVLAAGKVLKQYKNLSPELKNLYHRHKEITTKTMKQVERNEQEFLKKKKEYTDHLERSQEMVIEHVDKNLTTIFKNLEGLRINRLDENQQVELAVSVDRLKTLQGELKIASSYNKTKELLMECNKELDIIKQITKSIVPIPMRQKFDQDLAVFHKMLPIPQSTLGLVDQLSIPHTANLPPEQESRSNTASEELKSRVSEFESHEHVVELNEPESQGENQSPAAGNEDDIVQQTIQEQNTDDTDLANILEGSPSHQKMQNIRDLTRSIKVVLNSGRMNQSSPDIIRVVDPESQLQYKMSVEKMLERIDVLKSILSSDSDMLLKVNQLEDLLKNAVKLGFNQTNESELKDIHALAKELEEYDDGIIDPREGLSSTFTFLEQPNQNRSQL